MNEIIQKIKDVANSPSPDAEKLQNLVNLTDGLKPFSNAAALKLICDYGIFYSEKLEQTEMAAQFYVTRAKVLMAEPVTNMKELKEIKLAPAWFQFALESERKRYDEIDIQIKKNWNEVQLNINKCIELINKKPIWGAVAFCQKTLGEIYGSYYLQVRLYYFKSKSPFCARLANIYLFRWFGIDDYLVLDKATLKRLKVIKKDCLTNLHKAIFIFKQHKNYEYWAEALLCLANEHLSFTNPIRGKFYLFYAKKMIKKFGIKGLEGNLALLRKKL